MNFDTNPILFPSIIGAYFLTGLGGWWMMFKIVRYEKHIFPVIFIPLLIPNSFLWYYFERASHTEYRRL